MLSWASSAHHFLVKPVFRELQIVVGSTGANIRGEKKPETREDDYIMSSIIHAAGKLTAHDLGLEIGTRELLGEFDSPDTPEGDTVATMLTADNVNADSRQKPIYYSTR